MDQDSFVKELSECVEHPVAAHWHVISTGFQSIGSKNDLGQNDKVRSLHFERDLKDVPVVMPQQERIYCLSEEGDYPLGIKNDSCLKLTMSSITHTQK